MSIFVEDYASLAPLSLIIILAHILPQSHGVCSVFASGIETMSEHAGGFFFLIWRSLQRAPQ